MLAPNSAILKETVANKKLANEKASAKAEAFRLTALCGEGLL